MAMRDYIFILAVIALVIGVATGLFKIIVDIFKRFKMEKESIQEDIEGEAQSESKVLHTEQLLIETLKKIGCKPEKIDDDKFRFEYQGGQFSIAFSDTSAIISVRFLFWYEFSSYDIDKFAVMRECINEANIHGDCTVFYALNKETETVYLHSVNTSLFIKEIPRIEDYLCGILQDLFRSRNFVYSRIEKAMCKEND